MFFSFLNISMLEAYWEIVINSAVWRNTATYYSNFLTDLLNAIWFEQRNNVPLRNNAMLTL
jgi:hypothetical protein